MSTINSTGNSTSNFTRQLLIWGLVVTTLVVAASTLQIVTAVGPDEINGLVIDSGDTPVEGATVKYRYSVDMGGTADPLSQDTALGQTDAMGSWIMQSPMPGSYEFWAWRSDLGVTQSVFTSYVGTGVLSLPNLVFAASGGANNQNGEVSGFVNDASGAVQSGVNVQIDKFDAPYPNGNPLATWSVQTGADGSYVKSGLFTNYNYRVFLPDYTDSSPIDFKPYISSTSPSRSNLDFVISNSTIGEGAVSGRVSETDGSIAAGVQVKIEKLDTGGVEIVTWIVLTDSLGNFVGDGLPFGYNYRISLLDYPDANPASQGVSLSSAVPTRINLDFEITAASGNPNGTSGDNGIIWGYVKDVDVPLTGVGVEVSQVGITGAGEIAYTDSTGKYIVDSLAWPADYKIDVLPIDGVDRPDKFRYLDVGMTTKYASFLFDFSANEPIVPGAGGEDGTLSGKIKLPNGSIAAGVSVRVYAFNGLEARDVDIDTSGMFLMSLPPGVWFVGYEILDDEYAPVTLGDELVVSPGELFEHNIVIRRNASTLKVIVKNVDGTSFGAGAWVEVSRFSTTAETGEVSSDISTLEQEWFGKESDINGKAIFSLPPGAWYVRVSTRAVGERMNPKEEFVTISDGQTKAVTIRFRTRDATLRGRVLSNATGASVDAFVGAWSETGGFAEGRSGINGFYEFGVLGGETWYVGAMANIGGVLHVARPVDVFIGAGADITQNLVVKLTDFDIPPPIVATRNVSESFTERLENDTTFACEGGGCFAGSESIEISITPDVTTPDQGGVGVIGMAYEIGAVGVSSRQNITQLAKPARITIPYEDTDVTDKGVLERDLKIGFYDEAKGAWVELTDCAVDTAQNVVTCTTDHLTRFALLTPAYASIVGPGINEGDLIRGPDGVKIWIVNTDGYKRHIFNPAVFGMYGHFVWDNIVEVSQTTLDAYKTSDLYRALGDGRVFALEEVDEAAGLANKRWLDMTPERFIQASYDWLQVFEINTVERDFYQEGTSIK